MKNLLEKSTIDYPKVKRLVHKFTANELTNLSEPCYYPEVKKYYFEFLHACGVTDKIVRESVYSFYKGTPAAKWQLQSDPQSHLYIFLMNYFLTKRDHVSFASMMTFFCIRYYGNLIRRQIKYCNPDVFKYTLEHLAKTHLFSREKSISNAVFYISKEMQRKFAKEIIDLEPMIISKFIQESRHRLSQSVRSFGETYYKASREGSGLKTPLEPEEGDDYQYQTLEKTSRAVDAVVKKITVYKIQDRKAMDEAKKLTKVSTSLTTIIVNQLVDIKYSDNIKIILELFIKDVKSVDSICGDAYYDRVKSLMGIKRTTSKVFFKQQVEVLLQKVLTDVNYIDQYDKLTNQTQFLIKSFFGYYLTLVMRNTVC